VNIRSLTALKVLVLLLALLPTQKAGERGQQPNKNGTIVVLVTWGDDDNTPANDVYIEAHGFVRDYNSEKSFILKSSTPGRYEASLPAGVYDVFVSEGTSEPRCRRMRIVGGLPSTWTLKLEIDEVYTKR
jgi:hypothetical protein